MRKRVLVLDDEEPLARSVARALGTHYDVDIFLRGTDALEALSEQYYDCVISDMQMAGMSGQDFYFHASRILPDLETRFIFYTGSPEAVQIDLPCLVKPSGILEIRDMVDQLVHGPR